MDTKQRLLVLLIAAALTCSCGAQAPNDRAANGPGPSTTPTPDQVASDQAASGQVASGQVAPGQIAPGQPTPGQVDPPARVARLANMSGNVSFTPAGERDWVQAQLNRPVVTGDKLWTADGARAELQVGSSTVRLDYQSNFGFLNLNDQIAQMQLTHGTLNLDVWRLRGDETYEVDTPTIAFIANRVGDYRIDVDSQGGFTTVTARRGGGEAVGEGGKRVVIEEGQSIRFNDSALNNYQVNVSSPDDFDLYCTRRNERHVRAPARNYVSENVVGYEDLDEYGTWESVPQYGHVWYPAAIATDWAPYHAGHWIWVDPWGWTWVDDAPWGFAPFHYGRWAYVGTRWGWVPGPVAIAPVYAPALVAFVGSGGFGLSVSVGGPIGWFALGPGDVYFPGYGASSGYFSRVNVSNTYVNQTVVNNYYGAWSGGNVNYAQTTFANRNAPGALTAMPTTAFAAGQPVATSAVAVNRTTMANARVLPRATVAPTRASLVAGSGSATATPPATAVNRNVVAARAPAVQPSFAQRQALLQKNAGQPLSVNQMRTLAGAQPDNHNNARGATGTASNVRVVGDRGAAASASPLAPQPTGANATTPGGNNGRTQQAATTANGSALQNNAQREATAQSAPGRVNNAGTPNNAAGNGPQNSSATRGNQPPGAALPGGQNQTLPSSTFAHAPTSSGQGANTINRGGAASGMQQQRRTAATATNTGGGRNGVRGNEQTRSASAATTAQHSGRTQGQHAPQSAPMTSRPAYAQQHAPPAQHGAPIQHGAPQRMPVERAPQNVAQHAMPPHAPPPQQQRGAGPGSPPQHQTSMARSAPQHAAPPPHGGGDKKKDGGGG